MLLLCKTPYAVVFPLLYHQCQGSQTIPHAQLQALSCTSYAKIVLFIQLPCISRAKVGFSFELSTLLYYRNKIFQDQYGKKDHESIAQDFSPSRLLLQTRSARLQRRRWQRSVLVKGGTSGANLWSGLLLRLLVSEGTLGKDRLRYFSISWGRGGRQRLSW